VKFYLEQEDQKRDFNMKVIFLDIDGAMATSYTMKNGWKYKKNSSRLKYSNFIKDKKTLSRKCIRALNRLVVETKAKVVITSAWRYDGDTKYFQRLFISRGFCGEIIDLSPKWEEYRNLIGIETINDLQMFWEYERGNEIRLWLEWNKHKNIESYIIIDDDVDDIEPLYEGRFIHTNIDQGFQGEKLLQEAINKLKGENNDKID